MTNVYFPEELIKTDDLYFLCYMIERVARQLKQPNKYVANVMGHDELAKKLSLADVLHSENPLAVAADWIDEYQLKEGNYDVTKVDLELCPKIPTATQMRLLVVIMQGDSENVPEEDATNNYKKVKAFRLPYPSLLKKGQRPVPLIR